MLKYLFFVYVLPTRPSHVSAHSTIETKIREKEGNNVIWVHDLVGCWSCAFNYQKNVIRLPKRSRNFRSTRFRTCPQIVIEFPIKFRCLWREMWRKKIITIFAIGFFNLHKLGKEGESDLKASISSVLLNFRVLIIKSVHEMSWNVQSTPTILFSHVKPINLQWIARRMRVGYKWSRAASVDQASSFSFLDVFWSGKVF